MAQDIREIEIGKISPNLRLVFSSDVIEDIAHDIRSRNRVEPIHISFEHDSFRIIDGEKRWRACKRLGVRTIPAIIA